MPSADRKSDLAIASSLPRGLVNAGIAALFFLLTCIGLKALLPFPEIEVVSRHLRFFQKYKDDVDTIFFGSSRIRHQISPSIFDRAMADAGFPTRSFNFGINAMGTPENDYVLEHLLVTRPRHLKWVFIELDEIETKRIPELEGTRREVYWHDAKRTALVFRALFEPRPGERGGRFLGTIGRLIVPGGAQASGAGEVLLVHAGLFARNFTNFGRKTDLSRWITRSWREETFPDELGSDDAGYIPIDKRMPAAERSVYELELKFALANSGSRYVSAATEKAYQRLAEKVRKAGATPIFIVTPLPMQIKLGFRPESGIASTVMSFNDARLYPQFYRSEARIDRGHLNGAAAEEFTRVVAENFAQLRRQNRIE